MPGPSASSGSISESSAGLPRAFAKGVPVYPNLRGADIRRTRTIPDLKNNRGPQPTSRSGSPSQFIREISCNLQAQISNVQFLIDTIPKLESAATPTKQTTGIISNRYKLDVSRFAEFFNAPAPPREISASAADVHRRVADRNSALSTSLRLISEFSSNVRPQTSNLQFLIATQKRLEIHTTPTKQTAELFSNRYKNRMCFCGEFFNAHSQRRQILNSAADLHSRTEIHKRVQVDVAPSLAQTPRRNNNPSHNKICGERIFRAEKWLRLGAYCAKLYGRIEGES